MAIPTNNPEAKQLIETAFRRGLIRYFQRCRLGVDAFSRQHFSLPGAWHTNKVAWGWDMLRAPINLFWAPFYALILFIGFLCRKMQLIPVANLLQKMPSGITTDVQKHIADLLRRELLNGNNTHENALAHCIAVEIDNVLPTHSTTNHDYLIEKIEPAVHDALQQYAITRTASADITNSLFSTLIGAFTFKQFTPGGIAIGLGLASWYTNYLAANNFWLGEFWGSLFYGFFPEQPSLATRLLSIGIVLVLFSVFASFSGTLTDPIQHKLGIHQRRLNKMLDKLEQDFMRNKIGSFRPKDQYLARILEILDAAKSQLL